MMNKLTDVQKAFYHGYDKGWVEREKRFKIESENAIKKVLSERYSGSKVVNAELFAGHILREIGMITNDLEREMNNIYCKTCETETDTTQSGELIRCGMCGDSENLVYEENE